MHHWHVYLCKSFYSHPSSNLLLPMLKLFGKYCNSDCSQIISVLEFEWTSAAFQICFELKKNKQISNFFLPHSTSWHLRFTYNVDLRWSSAVGSWLQHLNWWWATRHLWGIYVNREKSTSGYLSSKKKARPLLLMQLMERIPQHLSEYGSPVSLKIKVLVMEFHPGLPRFELVFNFCCLVISRHYSCSYPIVCGLHENWWLKEGKWCAPSKGLGELRTELGVRFPFLGHILYHTAFCLLTFS